MVNHQIWAGSTVVLGPLVLGLSSLAQPASVARGHELAERICANCHVIDASASGSWTNAPSFQSIANQPGITRARIADYVKKLPLHMPVKDYTQAELNDVASYILSLRQK